MNKLLTVGGNQKESKNQLVDFYFKANESENTYSILENNEYSVLTLSFADYLTNNDYPYQQRGDLRSLIFEQHLDIDNTSFFIENAFAEWISLQDDSFNIELEVADIIQDGYLLIISMVMHINDEANPIEITI